MKFEKHAKEDKQTDYIYTLSHPGAQKSELRSASELQASIGRKIIEILKNRQNLQDPPKIYRYGYLRVGLCISNFPHPKIVLLIFSRQNPSKTLNA